MTKERVYQVAAIEARLEVIKAEMRRLGDQIARCDRESAELSRTVITPSEIAEREADLIAKIVPMKRRRDTLLQRRGLVPSLLTPGEPCPLCGSLHHPAPLAEHGPADAVNLADTAELVDGNTPVPGTALDDEVLSTLDERIADIESDIETLRRKRSDSEAALKRSDQLAVESERLTADRFALGVEVNSLNIRRGELLADVEI